MGFCVDYFIATIAATGAKSIIAPLENVKLIITHQYTINPLIREGKAPRYNGLADCFVRVYKEQGFTRFWRGNLVNVIYYSPPQALSFALNELYKSLLNQKDQQSLLRNNLLAGGLAGATTLCITYPAYNFDNTKSFGSLSNSIFQIVKGPAGIMGLYNGFCISLLTTVSMRTIYFGTYSSLVDNNSCNQDRGIFRIASKLLLAQTSVIMAEYASIPFDTVRSRLRLNALRPKEVQYYNGIVHAFMTIYNYEGLYAFFKFARPFSSRNISAALCLLFYDEGRHMLG